MQLQLNVLLYLALLPAWLISAKLLYGTSSSAKEDMVISYKPVACWLYPDSPTVLRMACASKFADVRGTRTGGNQHGECWPVTKDYLIAKGFQEFPGQAFTGSFNRGVLCRKEPADGDVFQYMQKETISPECDGYLENGIPTYHWFGYDGKPWWFGCTFKKH